MESNYSRLLSNALHDLGVCLHRSNEFDRALDSFDGSIRMRMASIKFASALREREGQAHHQVSEDGVALRERYHETIRQLQELRAGQQQGEGEDESRLDLFPLLLNPHDSTNADAAFFLPPVPGLVELGSDEREQEQAAGMTIPSSHNAQSARTLLNMALCNLSTATDQAAAPAAHRNFYKAEQYLSMASQLLPTEEEEDEEDRLLAADVILTDAIVSLANRRYYEAEMGAYGAFRLYSAAAAAGSRSGGENRGGDERLRRRADEGAADSLSLLLRVYHVAPTVGGRRRSDEALGYFDELIRLRVALYGVDSLRVAATVYSMGLVLMSSSSSNPRQGQGGRRNEAMECIKALVLHPSLPRVGAGARVRAEAARALRAVVAGRTDEVAMTIEQPEGQQGEVPDLDKALEEVLGVKFHAHAGAA